MKTFSIAGTPSLAAWRLLRLSGLVCEMLKNVSHGASLVTMTGGHAAARRRGTGPRGPRPRPGAGRPGGRSSWWTNVTCRVSRAVTRRVPEVVAARSASQRPAQLDPAACINPVRSPPRRSCPGWSRPCRSGQRPGPSRSGGSPAAPRRTGQVGPPSGPCSKRSMGKAPARPSSPARPSARHAPHARHSAYRRTLSARHISARGSSM